MSYPNFFAPTLASCLSPKIMLRPRQDFVLHPAAGAGPLTIQVVELAPRIRTIYYAAGGVTHAFRLSFPHIVFCLIFSCWLRVRLDEARAFYRTAPLWGDASTLSQCNMPNLLYGNRICMGDTTALACDIARAITPEDYAQAFLTDYWSKPFSNEALGAFHQSASLHPAFTSLASWEAASRRDPGFVLGIPWTQVTTLGDQVRQLRGGFPV